MESTKKKKCRNCGRLFEPKGPNDRFCSSLCRATGNFVGGGGDTSKPVPPDQKRPSAPKAKPAEPKQKKIRNGAERFPRVTEMFTLPVERRWAIAQTFTPEEQEYSRRVQKRLLMEERKVETMICWEGDCEEERLGSYEGLVGGSLGESDDGSV